VQRAFRDDIVVTVLRADAPAKAGEHRNDDSQREDSSDDPSCSGHFVSVGVDFLQCGLPACRRANMRLSIDARCEPH
jgi:hypothetical protein